MRTEKHNPRHIGPRSIKKPSVGECFDPGHLTLGDNGSDTPQREGFGREQLLKEMHLPSRSFSGVSAVYQSEGGPVPFTVMAATWKLYWLPFSSPV